MNGTTKLAVIEATEKARGKKGAAYRKVVVDSLSPASIAAKKPEHFPKTKKGSLK